MEETNQRRNDENGEIFGETDSDEDECRVCREKGGILICPCDCTGSMKYIHDHCLRRWVILKAGPLPVGAHGEGERGDIADRMTEILLARESMESCFSCNVCLAHWKPWRKRQVRSSLVQMENEETKRNEADGSSAASRLDDSVGADRSIGTCLVSGWMLHHHLVETADRLCDSQLHVYSEMHRCPDTI